MHCPCNDSKRQRNSTTLEVSHIHVCIGGSDVQNGHIGQTLIAK